MNRQMKIHVSFTHVEIQFCRTSRDNQQDELVTRHPHSLVSRLRSTSLKRGEKKRRRRNVNLWPRQIGLFATDRRCARNTNTRPERIRRATIFERCRLPTRIYLHFAHLSIDLFSKIPRKSGVTCQRPPRKNRTVW